MSPSELTYVTVKYEAPIVYFYFKDDTELGFPEMKELIKCAETMSGGKPYVTFSDVRVRIKVTDQGKKYVADPHNMKLFRGTAAFVQNSLYRFAVNFMQFFSKSKYPFRAFTNEKQAIAWLRTLPLNEH